MNFSEAIQLWNQANNQGKNPTLSPQEFAARMLAAETGAQRQYLVTRYLNPEAFKLIFFQGVCRSVILSVKSGIPHAYLKQLLGDMGVTPDLVRELVLSEADKQTILSVLDS